jgi:hypothetical protein
MFWRIAFLSFPMFSQDLQVPKCTKTHRKTDPTIWRRHFFCFGSEQLFQDCWCHVCGQCPQYFEDHSSVSTWSFSSSSRENPSDFFR